MSNNLIAMIVEGRDYEPRIIESIDKCFFKNKNGNIKFVPLPADQNIYMLWRRYIKFDDVDIIEVIRDFSEITKKSLEGYNRDSFSEVYLFMDLDKQQNNLPKDVNPNEVVQEMLKTFDNETENGKLYISYPMAEAIEDHISNGCRPKNGKCYVNPYDKKYKDIIAKNRNDKYIESLNNSDWNDFINIYQQRLTCLFNKKERISIKECKEINPYSIYMKQQDNQEGKILVISAFPEFIIDYFKTEKI